MKIKINIFALLILSISILAIFIVYWIEFFEKIQPCELCLYQRWPFYILLFLSLVILLAKDLNKVFFISVLISMVLFSSALLAAYHSGIERGIWPGFEACSNFTKIHFKDIDDLRKKILDIPIIRCDIVSWKILIFSLSNLNFILSLALFVVSLLLNIELLKKNSKKI